MCSTDRAFLRFRIAPTVDLRYATADPGPVRRARHPDCYSGPHEARLDRLIGVKSASSLRAEVMPSR